MSEPLILAAIVVAAASGIPGLFLPRTGRGGERLFVTLLTVAGVCAAAAAVLALARGASDELVAPWPVPGGRLVVRVDAIAAVFLLQIALLAVLGAWYGLAYWPQREHPRDGRKLRAFHGAVTSGMLLLVVAQNAVLFLGGWEIMAAAAFILISVEDEQPGAREVGYLYLLSTRASTLCLFAMFALLGAVSGTLDFGGWPRALASPARDAIFVLALCGFGLKAGIMPLHVWLPGAHATTPSHISALMSGALIKTGIYGLVRLTSMCEAPPVWWGYTLIGLGVVSGVFGVAFAIAQHDLKRLLAYHSVENIGIICLGLGVALLGRAAGRPALVALGIGGALLHVWNHGVFKALLFLGAGSVLHATGTRELDRLGGLLRRMPATGLGFLVGAVAICGLPPLNGLISELLVFLGLFGAAEIGRGAWLAGSLAAPALAFIGALALACFAKVFGTVFLGEPRSDEVSRAHEAPAMMLAPMVVLAAVCFAVGLGAPLIAVPLDAAARAWAGAELPGLAAVAPLASVSVLGAGLLALLLAVSAWLRARARAETAAAGTWDCGYAAPSARMQYTASSFGGGLVGLLAWALRPEAHQARLERVFPGPASFHSHVPDMVLDRGIVPAFSLAGRLLARLRPLHQGSVHVYLVYIVGALLALLVWS